MYYTMLSQELTINNAVVKHHSIIPLLPSPGSQRVGCQTQSLSVSESQYMSAVNNVNSSISLTHTQLFGAEHTDNRTLHCAGRFLRHFNIDMSLKERFISLQDTQVKCFLSYLAAKDA